MIEAEIQLTKQNPTTQEITAEAARLLLLLPNKANRAVVKAENVNRKVQVITAAVPGITLLIADSTARQISPAAHHETSRKAVRLATQIIAAVVPKEVQAVPTITAAVHNEVQEAQVVHHTVRRASHHLRGANHPPLLHLRPGAVNQVLRVHRGLVAAGQDNF